MRLDPFCPDCGVSIDLHDGPDMCEEAGAFADQIAEMSRMFALGVTP